jgi:hypothetical protein
LRRRPIRSAPALEVGLPAEELGDLDAGLLPPPEVPQAAGPHEAAPEEPGVAVAQGGLVGLVDLAASQVVRPQRVVGVGQVVGIKRDGLADERRAPVPLTEEREQEADRLEVDERLRVERERILGLGSARAVLALDEQRERQGRARPLARRVEADGILGEGQALLDRGVRRRDLERVVGHVEPGELDPRQRALRIRGHGAS